MSTAGAGGIGSPRASIGLSEAGVEVVVELVVVVSAADVVVAVSPDPAEQPTASNATRVIIRICTRPNLPQSRAEIDGYRLTNQ
jgi:hypothetical protein